MRLRLSPLLGPSLGLAIAIGCGDRAPATSVRVDTSLSAPRALLDKASKVRIVVYEGAEAACAPARGEVTFPSLDDPTAATQVAKGELGSSGCGLGLRFCGDLSVARADTDRVFSAVAVDSADAPVAIGCTTAKISEERATLEIKLLRFVAPPQCNNGKLEPTEQCEPGASATCDEGCLSREVLLSVGSSQTGTQTGGPNDKSDPFFLWPAGTGTTGRFFAFYTDRAVPGGGNNVEVALRAMGPDLAPLTTPPALAAGSIFLPNGAAFPPSPAPRQQSTPQAAFLNGKYYVAFQDDDSPGANGIDIHLRSMDSALVAEQQGDPLGINGAAGAGEANIQGSPAIAAGPRNRLYVAWEDASLGKVAGRTFTPPATLGNQTDISTGTGNKSVSLAGTPQGWVAVWLSGTAAKLRILNEDGVGQGLEQTVNEGGAAERPRVASLPDGRFAVTWAAGGDIFVQRFTATGSKVGGDQAARINDVVFEGVQTQPTIAALPAAVGGAYAVAWLDAESGHVRARLLGGSSGFLFNNVDGQTGEFQASRQDGHTRATPVAVAGGSGPFLAIGWEDRTAPTAGIVSRLFPMPVE